MTTETNTQQLEQIERLLNEYYGSEDSFEQTDLAIEIIQEHVGWLVSIAKETQRCTKEIARLREALEFYAEETRYMYTSRSLKGHPTIINDEGATARQALKGE